ncbi:MAG: FecR domain-containing protein [Phenylobacterium sp.]|uniref:FecR family protein n=1 Tax=Phenylobacterium sp. TaxID=1871053 RepID=UPI002733AF08|nr:FecR domain-containing protein [Phenylobacterium sp.]MDP3749280.1 FecR domain-containing protein [Phenylobacterium sp.]
MASAAASAEPDLGRLVEAAAWRVRLAEAGLEGSDALEAWLARDPANEAAWRRVQQPWDEIGDLATAPELMVVRRDALDRARRHSRARWIGPTFTPRRIAGAATIAATLALAIVALWGPAQPTVYETSLGERRVVRLDDGSRVALDSTTRLKVRFTKDARTLDLVRGQARFDVAKDVTRPFSVRAGHQTIVATGTIFSVDLLGPRVLVTLIEGRVSVVEAPPRRLLAIERRAPPSKSIELRVGDRLVAKASADGATAEVEQVSLDKATAWESGQLVFEDEPLSAVAERISRYTSSPVIVKDRDAGALRISGVFTAGDLPTFVDTVTHYLPVEAASRADGVIELRSRG